VEKLVFYFDRNVGRRLPEAFKLLKLQNVWNVVHHHTRRGDVGMREDSPKQPLFEDFASDDAWLEFVGKQGWIVFTQDRKFHTDGYEVEMSAIKQFNVGCFYLWGAEANAEKKALSFLKALAEIREAIKTTPKPFIYDISKSGKLTAIRIP
jgi:hypothetical protein